MIRRPDIFTVVCIAGVLLTSSPGIAPAVLCIGADGHVALESNGAGWRTDCRGCHGRTQNETCASYDRTGEGAGDCGVCVDSALPQVSRPTASDDDAAQFRLRASAAAGPRADVLPVPIAALGIPIVSASRTFPHGAQALDSLQTVVIRC